MGTSAHMPIQPWGAMLLGTIAGLISVLGYKYLTVSLSLPLSFSFCLSSSVFLVHDTCGMHNLHGMPGVLAAIGGAVATAMSSKETWGDR